MKSLLHILIAFVLIALYSCGKQKTVPDANKNDYGYDFSLFYQANGTGEYIYDAHRNVPLGKMVVLSDLDNLFGKPFVCDTVKQTYNDWALYEQECQAADFMPSEMGDTLVMMRRIYGKQGDWIIWIDLEIQKSDSLRVLNFLAYDNSEVDI